MFNNLTLIQKGSNYYIDSREVATIIEKPHNDLMKAIRKYCDFLNEGNLSHVKFFIKSSYEDSKGEIRPCYLLSKLGCELIANKLIGKKGVLFTATYVAKFNEMEAYLRSEWEKSQMQLPTLEDCNDTANIVINQLKRTGVSTYRMLDFLDGLYEPLGISILENGEFDDIPQTYTALQIAYICGMYSLYGNPHAQAVSCIISENLFLNKHKLSVSDNYHTGLMGGFRYDEHVLQEVKDWLAECNYPSAVYGVERTYHVVYRPTSSNSISTIKNNRHSG